MSHFIVQQILAQHGKSTILQFKKSDLINFFLKHLLVCVQRRILEDCIYLTHFCGAGFKLGRGRLSCVFASDSVQSLSHVWLFATLWTTACHASLSITNSWSPPKSMSIELVMPSNHLILYRPLLLLPSIFPSITVFSNESALRMRWPEYWWSFSFSVSPSSEHPGLISFRIKQEADHLCFLMESRQIVKMC